MSLEDSWSIYCWSSESAIVSINIKYGIHISVYNINSINFKINNHQKYLASMRINFNK